MIGFLIMDSKVASDERKRDKSVAAAEFTVRTK